MKYKRLTDRKIAEMLINTEGDIRAGGGYKTATGNQA